MVGATLEELVKLKISLLGEQVDKLQEMDQGLWGKNINIGWSYMC